MTPELLQEGSRTLLKLELSPEQLVSFQLYYEELVSWNERTNLTAITAYPDVQLRHFLDSLTLAASHLRNDPAGFSLDLNSASLIDIGAGAGFPGLPLKILFPGLKLTLSDSVGKKTAFLQHMVEMLKLDKVEVLNARAEELGQNPAYREKFSIATGRAVAALNVLAEYCLPLVKVGGLFIAPKKVNIGEELAQGARAIKKLGGKMRSATPFALPGEETAERMLVVAEKISQTPAAYPRQTGAPAKKPLV
jgi:16S rRNA (guanine527-N7)-methyltransferase